MKDHDIPQSVAIDIGAKRGTVFRIRFDANDVCASDRSHRAGVPAEIGADIDEQSGLRGHDLQCQGEACGLVAARPENGPADIIFRIDGDNGAAHLPHLDASAGQSANEPADEANFAGVLEGAGVCRQDDIAEMRAFGWRQRCASLIHRHAMRSSCRCDRSFPPCVIGSLPAPPGF